LDGLDLEDADLDLRFPDAFDALAFVRPVDLDPDPDFRWEPLLLEPTDFAFFFAIFCCLLVCAGSISVVRIPASPQP